MIYTDTIELYKTIIMGKEVYYTEEEYRKFMLISHLNRMIESLKLLYSSQPEKIIEFLASEKKPELDAPIVNYLFLMTDDLLDGLQQLSDSTEKEEFNFMVKKSAIKWDFFAEKLIDFVGSSQLFKCKTEGNA